MARPPIFESYSQVLPPPGPEMLPVSKPAVFGLLLSILQCLPVIAGAGAMVLGLVGLREIRTKQRIGKPIALAAIAIGGLSCVLWIVVLSVGAFGAVRYTRIYETAERFAQAAAEGRFEAARALASPEVDDETVALWVSELHVEEADAQAEMRSIEFDEDSGAGPRQMWDGPFLVVNRVSYRDGTGAEAVLPRRALVRVEIINGQPRVVGVEVREWTRAAAAPPFQFE